MKKCIKCKHKMRKEIAGYINEIPTLLIFPGCEIPVNVYICQTCLYVELYAQKNNKMNEKQ